MSEEKDICGWVKVYHPSGLQVTLPLLERKVDYLEMFANLDMALQVGFLAQAPGLEAGELKEECGAVVRRSKDNGDGSSTPIIDLYGTGDHAKFAFLTVYLNTDADVRAFESASKLQLAAIPAYIGDNKIERGKKKETDKMIAIPPKPFPVIYQANPKYDATAAKAAQEGGKMYAVPKRRFLRWGGLDSQFADCMRSIKSSQTMDALHAAWKEAYPCIQAGTFTNAQADELTAAKDARKNELGAPKT